MDQNKVNQICSKANFTNGIASYVLNFTDSLSNTSNAISNSLNSYNSTDAVNFLIIIKNKVKFKILQKEINSNKSFYI